MKFQKIRVNQFVQLEEILVMRNLAVVLTTDNARLKEEMELESKLVVELVLELLELELIQVKSGCVLEHTFVKKLEEVLKQVVIELLE